MNKQPSNVPLTLDSLAKFIDLKFGQWTRKMWITISVFITVILSFGGYLVTRQDAISSDFHGHEQDRQIHRTESESQMTDQKEALFREYIKDQIEQLRKQMDKIETAVDRQRRR